MERDTAFCNPHFFFQVRQSTTCVTIINVFFFFSEKQRFLLAEFRELVEDFKTQMCDLVLELKEKYKLQKQRLLTVIKNGRGHRYEHQETKVDSYYQELGTSHSEDKNDLAAGIVVSRPFFEEENLTVESCADLCITQEQSDC